MYQAPLVHFDIKGGTTTFAAICPMSAVPDTGQYSDMNLTWVSQLMNKNSMLKNCDYGEEYFRETPIHLGGGCTGAVGRQNLEIG